MKIDFQKNARPSYPKMRMVNRNRQLDSLIAEGSEKVAPVETGHHMLSKTNRGKAARCRLQINGLKYERDRR
jgi:hypothetical protein